MYGTLMAPLNCKAWQHHSASTKQAPPRLLAQFRLLKIPFAKMSASRVAVTLYRSLLRVKRDYAAVRVPLPALPLPPDFSLPSSSQGGYAGTTIGCTSSRERCVTAQIRALFGQLPIIEGQKTTSVPDPLDGMTIGNHFI